MFGYNFVDESLRLSLGLQSLAANSFVAINNGIKTAYLWIIQQQRVYSFFIDFVTRKEFFVRQLPTYNFYNVLLSLYNLKCSFASFPKFKHI